MTAYPFAFPGGDTGVFQKVADGPWTMNYFETVPFPCPPFEANVPGPGSALVPLAVLKAVKVNYARRGCDDPYAIQSH
jgi:hypothetical protein